MTSPAKTTRWLTFVAAMLCCGASHAGLNEGLAALAKGDYPVAVMELRPLADAGNAEAQYRVGLMYEFGKGYPQDKLQGIVWFRMAAAQNHAAAQTELGIIHVLADGVPQDNKQAVEWLQKGAANGNVAAQYNLGLLYAKGQGVKLDNAQAIAWWRKAADQGYALAQFKLGVAYENGEGVGKDPVLAYAMFAIAARNGNKESAAYRDNLAGHLSGPQALQAQAITRAWNPGQPMPTSVAAAALSPAVAAAAPVKDRCNATGQMGGTRFTASNCAVSLYGDQHSVAIWFNEDTITPQEAEEFRATSYAKDSKDGKRRTMLVAMFCPGGGAATAAPAAMKTIDLNTSHAKSPLDGVQWVVEAGKDFKVEKMTGELKPGGVLAGKVTGARDKTSFNLDFEVNLPAKDAAAGMGCGK